MKKLSLVVAVLCCSIALVGCGKATPSASTNTDSNTVVENWEAWTKEVVVKNDGAVVASPETIKLAQCLTENGVKMYWTERCGHCKNQKKLFGEAFTHVDYTDCDADKKKCVDAWVQWFPTWIDSEWNPYPGTQNLEKLANINA